MQSESNNCTLLQKCLLHRFWYNYDFFFLTKSFNVHSCYCRRCWLSLLMSSLLLLALTGYSGGVNESSEDCSKCLTNACHDDESEPPAVAEVVGGATV